MPWHSVCANTGIIGPWCEAALPPAPISAGTMVALEAGFVLAGGAAAVAAFGVYGRVGANGSRRASAAAAVAAAIGVVVFLLARAPAYVLLTALAGVAFYVGWKKTDARAWVVVGVYVLVAMELLTWILCLIYGEDMAAATG